MAAVVDREACDACETCVDLCPSDAIQIVDEKAKVTEDACIECGMCRDDCPKGAIDCD